MQNVPPALRSLRERAGSSLGEFIGYVGGWWGICTASGTVFGVVVGIYSALRTIRQTSFVCEQESSQKEASINVNTNMLRGWIWYGFAADCLYIKFFNKYETVFAFS